MNPTSTSSPTEMDRVPRANFQHSVGVDVWRKLILASGLALAVCCFLPVSSFQPSPVSLFGIGLNQWSNPSVTLFDHFDSFCAQVAGYFFGALMALGALARLMGRVKLNRWCCMAVFLLLISTAFLAFLETWSNQWQELAKGVWQPFAAGMIVTLAALAYVVAASRLGPRAMVCYEFAGSLAAAVWFGFSWSPTSLNSSIAFIASISLLIGIIGEAHLVLRHAWVDTEYLLVTCLFGERNLSKDAVV